MRKVIGIAAFLLSIAAPADELLIEFDMPEVQVTVFEHDGRPEICDSIAQEKSHACASWDQAQKTCTIHVPRPKNNEDSPTFWLLGRELYHCLHGSYHP